MRGEGGHPESSSPKGPRTGATQMSLEHVPRCQHVKVNGVQCGSPALRHRAHCFFHTRVEYEREVALENNCGKRSFGFPLLEDATSIQVALMKVIYLLGSGALDHKTAGLMLYALQTASYNLRNAKFEPEKLTDVVIDEDTVDLTRMRGPQWSTRDFQTAPGEVRSESRNETKSEDCSQPENEVQSQPRSEKQKEIVNKDLADVVRRREQKRKLLPFEEDNTEPDGPTKAFLRELGVLSEDEKSIKLPEQTESRAG